MNKALRHAAGAVIAALLVPEPVLAQLEEVVVTARKKEETADDVPISISVTPGAEIQRSGVKGLEEFTQNLPAVNVSKGGASDQLYVRGIGSGFNAGFEQATGTYIDGVYFGRSRNTRLSFLDLDRLEVLKGPQTTFFGNSSIAGALSAITRSPGRELGGNFSVLYTPEFDETDVQGAVDLPLHETFRVRLAGRKYDTDGYYDNTNSGVSGPRYDDWGFRVTAVWEPLERFDAMFKYTTGGSTASGVFASDVFRCPTPPGLPGAAPTRPCPANLAAFPHRDPRRIDGEVDFVTQTSANEPGKQSFDFFNLTWNLDLGFATLTSVTAHNEFSNFESQDLDQSELLIFQPNQFDSFDSWAQELRLASNSDRRVRWIAGGYYQTQDVQYDVYLSPFFIPPISAFNAMDPTTTLANESLNSSTEDTVSAFGVLTLDITDMFRVNLGLRYTRVEKDFTIANRWVTFAGITGVIDRETVTEVPFVFPGFAITTAPVSTGRTADDWLPSVDLEYDVFDDGLLYFSFRQGFKAGGFNHEVRDITAANVDSVNFGPEEVNAYEVGFKGTWLDGRLKTNVNLFQSDYTGVQQSVLDATTFVFSVKNAAASRTRGLELELAYTPFDRLTLFADATLLDAEFADFIGACNEFQNQIFAVDPTAPGACPQSGGPGTRSQDLSGHETTFAPEYSGNIRAVYDHAFGNGWGLTADLSLFFSDDYFIQSDFDPFTRVRAFQRLSARVAIAPPPGLGDWEIAFVGKNLNDVERAFFCNDLSASPGSYRCSLNPPRSLAVQVGLRF